MDLSYYHTFWSTVIKQIFEQLINHQDLSKAQMREVIVHCMTGRLTDTQIAVFLALMRMKGETVNELSAAAHVMRELAHTLNLGSDLIDIVGTGGDGKNIFNVSTACSFVAATMGLRVAKHGNRSFSSRSGSADLLLEAGFELYLPDDALKLCLETYGIAFLFAPHFHQAMQHTKSARQQLAIRTLFNLLGPLINPAQVQKQVVGVFAKSWLRPIAEVLSSLGSQRALVVHAEDGLDEISISAKTDVVEYHNGTYNQWQIDPRDFNCFHANLDSLVVDSPRDSLNIITDVLKGKKGPAYDLVLLNTAAAVYCADVCPTFEGAVAKVALVMESGNAFQRFTQVRDLTKQYKSNHHE